jgi:hypothetical protein
VALADATRPRRYWRGNRETLGFAERDLPSPERRVTSGLQYVRGGLGSVRAPRAKTELDDPEVAEAERVKRILLHDRFDLLATFLDRQDDPASLSIFRPDTRKLPAA